MKTLYWNDKKSVFSFNRSIIKYGDRIDFKIEENKLKTLIEENKIKEVETPEQKITQIKVEEKKVYEKKGDKK